MAKINLIEVKNGNTLSALNANFAAISAELQNKVLYRNNPVGETNTIRNNLDADGNDIFNVNELEIQDLVVQGVPVPGTDLATIPGLNAKVAALETGLASTNTTLSTTINTVNVNAAVEDTNNKRSLRLSSTAIAPLNEGAGRAGKFLAFDQNGAPIVSSGTGADEGLRVDIAAPTGGTLVGFQQDGTGSQLRDVNKKLKDVVVTLGDFGGVEDGVTDDTVAFQRAVDSLATTGGDILIKKTALIGGVTISTEGINIRGRGNKSIIKVKNGTIGILVTANFVSMSKIRFVSEGTKADGLNTRGLLYEKTPVNSIGLASLDQVDFRNFSGYGGKIINAINFRYTMGQIVSCTDGFVFDRDATATYFGTTVSIDDIYVSSCTNGILANYLWRSRLNVIAEGCSYGIRTTGGAFTLFRCYFEGNTVNGCFTENSEVQDLYSYSNNTTTDAVNITFTGAVAATDRGYARSNKYDSLAKRVGVLSNFGTDPQYFEGFGGASTAGLKFGTNIVPLVRGKNLMDNSAWVAQRLGEFLGWDMTQQGYKISGTTAGDTTYGMKQSVTVSTAKQYVIDIASTTVTGSGILNIKCGTVTVTNGVPFTPAATGSQVVTAYGIDTAGTVVECYIHAFSISEVLADTKQTAIAQTKLTSAQDGRGVIYMAAAPTTGYWAVREKVYHSTPVASGNIGWVCVTAGTPGTWKTFGAIGA